MSGRKVPAEARGSVHHAGPPAARLRGCSHRAGGRPPVGHRVTAEAEVTKVDGRRIEFKVSARDEIEDIGIGTHERMVVDMPRLTQRLKAKQRP